MAQSPAEMEASMIANLKEKTGRSLEGWLKITRKSGLAKHGQIVKLLKTEYGMTHGYAGLVAHRTLQPASSGPSETDLVEAQYAGPKVGLRPIYEALVGSVEQLGPDVQIAPKKTYVSLRRNKQFALIQPSTRTRVDVGINLKGVAPTARLEASGSFNAMVSHRVRLTEKREVDGELIGWLRQAYEDS
jgi:predicted transport protein